MRSMPLLNPSEAGAHAKMEVNTGIQKNGGNWSSISTYYLNANFRISRTVDIQTETILYDSLSGEEDSTEKTREPRARFSTPFHVMGITLLGDKEGTFLSRTGVYGLYAWHTRIRPAVFLSAGIALGIKNYAVDETYVTGGGSAYSPDGNIGVSLYSDRYRLGISANQIFHGKLAPIREVTRLIPHLNLTGSRTWHLNRSLVLKPSLLLRIAPKHAPEATFYLGTLVQRILSVTAGYSYQKGMTYIIGLEKVRIENHYFKVAFSYYFPMGNRPQLRINTYEITLNYFLKPNHNRDEGIF